MRRRLLIVAVFLLAGAVVNVAVAWGCAMWGSLSRVESSIGVMSVIDDETCVVYRFDWKGATRYMVDWNSLTSRNPFWTSAERALPRWAAVSFPNADEFLSYTKTHVDARGWPMRTLWSCFHYPLVGQTIGETRGVRIPRRPRIVNNDLYVTYLPLGPIWTGLAINTVFYAAILWPLICGPFALRRLIRRRRGLCRKCAYPMGNSNVCTECGRAVPGRMEPAT